MFISNIDKAKVLVEALPYIQNYYGKTIVVNYGGNAMENEGLKSAVISDLVLLKLVGINVVVVHGGGPEITAMFDKLDVESRFINNIRYTSKEAIELIQMVLSGKTNKDLVNKINAIEGKAIGLSGIDGGMIKAKKLDDGKNDYGYVGEITEVDTKIITDNIAASFIPVIASIATGCDKDNTVYDINTDIAAAKIAIALGAEKLILLTDTRGLMNDPKDDDTLIPEVKLSEIDGLIKDGVITGDMLAKIDCCKMCVENGVKRAHIIDGRLLHSILIEMLSNEGIGTMIVE